MQPPTALFADTALAVAYSGFRPGQSPGGELPTREQIAEDLTILADAGVRLIRLYDSGEVNRMTLAVIQERELPIQVVLGAWLNAEVSPHETCEWVTEPIPDTELAANAEANTAEVGRAIELANAFPDIVVAVNVGNEALVTWNDHLVSIESMVAHLQRTSEAIEQPVTTADNYVPWVEYAEQLGPVVDFAMVHTYPVWEGRPVDEGLSYTVDNLTAVRVALPEERMVIGEAGWPSVASEFPDRVGEAEQLRYNTELIRWAREHNVTTFLFEAFDEPWKGNPADPDGAEKHWGHFYADRTPKPAAAVLAAP